MTSPIVPLFQGLLTEIEAQGDAEGALTHDEALALACETGEHWSDALYMSAHLHPAARAGARESCADFRAGVWNFNQKPE